MSMSMILYISERESLAELMYATLLGVSTTMQGFVPTLGVMARKVMRDMLTTLTKTAPVAPVEPRAQIAREVVSDPVSYKSHEPRFP